LTQTLGDNGFSQGSILHVEKGPQLTLDHVMVQIFVYEPYATNGKPFKRLSKTAVLKHSLISDIKLKLGKSKNKMIVGHPTSQMRLHQMQRTSGVHPLMRDDKTLQQCVKKLEDDTKLCVRLLDVPETVTKDDVVVVVRLWRPMTEGTECGTLDRGEDVVVNKFVTAEGMREAIEKVYKVTMGGVVGPLRIAKSHMASADERDLKKKTMEQINNAAASSISTLQWVELPSAVDKDVDLKDVDVKTIETGTNLSASDVGGLPTPVPLECDVPIVQSSIGILRDGTILYMHQGKELKNAITKWTIPAEEDTEANESGSSVGNSRSGGGRRSMARNPNWKSGGAAADGTKRNVPRRKEMGIKIRTHFDAEMESKVETGIKKIKSSATSIELQEKEVIVAGGAVQAARLLQTNKI